MTPEDIPQLVAEAHANALVVLDVLCEALSRVEVYGQSGDVEDYDDALVDAHRLLGQGGEDA